MKSIGAAWVALALCGGPAWPAEAPADRWTQIDAAMDARQWQAARAALQALLQTSARNAWAESRLAEVLLYLHQLDDAKQHLDRAEAIGLPGGQLAYRRAQWLAQTGDHAGALQQLDDALKRGLGPRTRPATDPLLMPLHDNPRFAAFIEQFVHAVTPCEADPRYRQLDYWVGTWDVRPRGAPPDSPPSENVLTLDHDRCIVQEHWRGIGGVTGSSFNLYDASRDIWVQVWADSTGGLHEYKGHLDAEGNMRFEGDTPGGPGQPARVPTRLTIFRQGPDQVRQFSESSVDGGKTWTVNYDLVYVRRSRAGGQP